MVYGDGRRQNKRGMGGKLREEIIRAAVRLVERDEAVPTLRAVAREAGITAPSVYGHFDDLQQILRAVKVRTSAALTEHLRESIAGIEDPVERLRAVCHGYAEFGFEQPQRYRLLFTTPVYQPPAGEKRRPEDVEGADAFAWPEDQQMLDVMMNALAHLTTQAQDGKDAGGDHPGRWG